MTTTAAISAHPSRLRSLYRQFLRELPARSPSILANPSPIQKHIRADFVVQSSTTSTDVVTPASPEENGGTDSSSSSSSTSPSLDHAARKPVAQRLAEAEQHLQYLRSQREYISLLERYNPGMNMNEEERVRLTARRVGMDLPIEIMGDAAKGQGGGGGGEQNGST